jgi:hypothetical protein
MNSKYIYRFIALPIICELVLGGCGYLPDNQRKKQAAMNAARSIATELGFAQSDYIAEHLQGHDFTKATYALTLTTTMDIPTFHTHVLATGKARKGGTNSTPVSFLTDIGSERVKVNGRKIETEDRLKLMGGLGDCWLYDMPDGNRSYICLYEFKGLTDTYTVDNKITLRSNVLSIQIGFSLTGEQRAFSPTVTASK